jgi:Tfp pilus assembly protein PilX
MKKQGGFLLLSAVVLIVVMGFVASTIAYDAVTESQASSEQVDYDQAFYIANAGLQRAIAGITGGDINSRIACGSVSGDSNYTAVSFASGQFSVTGAGNTLSTTLTLAVNASTTILPVASVSGFNAQGVIMLDSEVLTYSGTSTSSGSCAGDAPCFTGVTRAAGGSTAAPHVILTPVAQSSCNLVSTGAVSTIANPSSLREVRSGVGLMPDAWLVGDRDGSETVGRWDGAAWTRRSASSVIPNVHLNAIAMLSYADMWIAGNRNSSNANLVHWDGSSWTRYLPSPSVNQHLYGISCIASNDCWAVGNARTFLHWDGSGWTTGNVKTNGNTNSGKVPNKQFRAVSCSSANNCFAVGQADGGEALYARWDGSQWKRVVPDSSVPDQNLYGVSCPGDNDCWAVGKRDSSTLNISHWNGSTWTRVNPAVAVNSHLYGVNCTSSNDCWAVGQRKSGDVLLEHYNGTNWSRVLPTSGDPNQDLWAVNCANPNSCWAVGKSGATLYYDGSTWVGVSNGDLPNDDYRAVAGIAPNPDFPVNALWEET